VIIFSRVEPAILPDLQALPRARAARAAFRAGVAIERPGPVAALVRVVWAWLRRLPSAGSSEVWRIAILGPGPRGRVTLATACAISATLPRAPR
jgi:NhaP-type Na+/H+ or K+/H+ antiporter